MALLYLPPGLLLPTLTGYCLVRLLEGSTPVLLRMERWVYGFAIGTLFTMYITFLLHVFGPVALDFTGYVLAQLLLTILFGGLWFLFGRSGKQANDQLCSDTCVVSLWVKIIMGIVAVWTTIKIAIGVVMAFITPAYFDDVLTNWNMRGKMFYVAEKLILESEPGVIAGTASYPPSVPMLKAWLATLAGQWHEGLVSGVHVLWFFAALLLLYYALRRLLPAVWSSVGVYILASLPLYLMHGTNSYADCFLSVHVFLAAATLFFAYRSSDTEACCAFLRLSALATGLLVFTKNEALLLYIPPLVLLYVFVVVQQVRSGHINLRSAQKIGFFFCMLLGVFVLPWLIYKWTNHLTFGNAKSLTGLRFSYEPLVLKSIALNTFFEGNWNLLPPLFVGLFIAKWRTALRTPMIILSVFFLVVYFGQYPIYLFTSLSTEALNQTGYARGLIHLMPVVVLIVTVLLHDVVSCRQCQLTQPSSGTSHTSP